MPLIRRFDIGERETGVYVEPERAVHWDGRNELGEMVASGIYFYTMNCRLATKIRSEQSGNYTVMQAFHYQTASTLTMSHFIRFVSKLDGWMNGWKSGKGARGQKGKRAIAP